MSEYDRQLYKSGNKKLSSPESQKALVERNQKYIISVLSAGCVDCGNSDIRVLEFDHISNDKFKNVSALRTGSLEKIKEEIAKCEVVCANCHKIRTYGRMNNCYRKI